MQPINPTEPPTQTDEAPNAEHIPSWWTNEKTLWENRFATLENQTHENKEYLQRIISLVSKETDSIADSSPEKETRNPAPVNTGKQPVQVTVLHPNEKYSFQPEAPGILSSQPTIPPPGFQKQNEDHGESSLLPQLFSSGKQTNPSSFCPRPKIEIPMFDGTNPRSWVRKCQRYFNIFAVPETQKLELATMYLTDKAEIWFDGYIMQKHKLSWHEFVADICHRFETKNLSDVIEDFNKLFQLTTVDAYQQQFEELTPLMLQHNSHLDEAYFVSSFISGLKEELRHKVKVHEPKTLAEAAKKAKLYELALEIDQKKPRYYFKQNLHTPSILPQKPIPPTDNLKERPTAQTLAAKQSLIDYRRANNLCFKCGDKFSPAHQCKPRQFLMMEETIENYEQQADTSSLTTLQPQTEEELTPTTDPLEISINALTGNSGYSTIRIRGTVKGKPLNILIDSGSTHSFLTPSWAKDGVEIEQTHPLLITVANGERLQSTALCKQLQWQMQGHLFEHDFRIITMGGTDMVLGVDWMRLYSPIILDFKAMTLSFKRGDKEILLQGGHKPPVFKMITEEKLHKLSQKDPNLTGELYLLCAETEPALIPASIQPLLEEFKDVFQEPTGLPPKRTHDHAITLKPEATPVNLRPYRFPFHQKTEVEKQIKEMLAASIIQTSKSPFASPCLLVKKKDGTWRLCVDYRHLNALTVKNKFPMPIVEDLLDELAGATHFSKIDLRSGYWQIRIQPEDIPKTAFRTHHDHYEFKVMPFGLTNAPATFQSLMNEFFGQYLRKFVLVFFDDILIYSSGLNSHIQHLRLVLSTLRRNQLFARRSKCSFGQPQVEYLGHIISSTGVATDPTKIEAMRLWELPKTLKSLRGFLGLTGRQLQLSKVLRRPCAMPLFWLYPTSLSHLF
ncbi:hypothetical protein GQ457_01G052960 [Hibiscus cannabinus]